MARFLLGRVPEASHNFTPFDRQRNCSRVHTAASFRVSTELARRGLDGTTVAEAAERMRAGFDLMERAWPEVQALR